MTTFTFHTDPGHGWLEVPAAELIKAQLMPSDFSAYSYIRGTTVFLEEDCDAAIFIRSYEAHVGPFKAAEKHTEYEHWIRQLKRIESITDDDSTWF